MYTQDPSTSTYSFCVSHLAAMTPYASPTTITTSCFRHS